MFNIFCTNIVQILALIVLPLSYRLKSEGKIIKISKTQTVLLKNGYKNNEL